MTMRLVLISPNQLRLFLNIDLVGGIHIPLYGTLDDNLPRL